MRFFLIFSLLFSFKLNASEDGFEHQLQVRQDYLSEMADVSIENWEMLEQLPSLSEKDLLSEEYSEIYETQNLSIHHSNGYYFHIAEYENGTKVITCLNGCLVGLQGIAIDGVIVYESHDLSCDKEVVVHTYEIGCVYTYPDKQIMYLY